MFPEQVIRDGCHFIEEMREAVFALHSMDGKDDLLLLPPGEPTPIQFNSMKFFVFYVFVQFHSVFCIG